MLMLAAAALCVWATINRDQRNRRILTDSMDVYRKALQQHYDTYGTLPAMAPILAPRRDLAPLDYYAEPATQFYASRTADPVIVGYSPLAQLFVSYSGRSVIILEKGTLRTEWINEGRLRRMVSQQDRAAAAALEQARAAPVRLPD